jgi:predicted HAD superfamily Cof-like phosphohydrolase
MKPTPFELLREFHETYGGIIDQDFSEDLVRLRINLIEEEFEEVINELEEFPTMTNIRGPENINKKALTKELADLMYVTIGFATTFGLPLEEVFYAVHESNMSKLTKDGKVLLREDGKVLKSDQYKEPQLDQFFET